MCVNSLQLECAEKAGSYTGHIGNIKGEKPDRREGSEKKERGTSKVEMYKV
jgi:hypothetical protein